MVSILIITVVDYLITMWYKYLMKLKKQDVIRLGWFLLEQRVRYYDMDEPVILDYEYDMLERIYIKQARRLKIKQKLSKAVGVDMTLPSYIAAREHILLGSDPIWFNYKKLLERCANEQT